MAPPALQNVSVALSNILSTANVSLGKNFIVSNDKTTGVITTPLPIKTTNVITAKGLNINPTGSDSTLTIGTNGDINSAGALSLAGKLTINDDKFTVSSAGVVAVASDFAVATDKFKVTASSGAVSAAGDFAVATDKFKVTASSGAVAAAGSLSAAGDLAINTDKFKVTASSGAVAAAGDLTINGNKFIVTASSGDVTTAGSLKIATGLNVNVDRFKVVTDGSLTINDSTTTAKFTVNSTSGNVAAAGEVSVTGDLKINTNKFTVTASSGDVYTVGKITASDNLTINTDKFKVTASSGAVAAAGDFAIATDKFKVTASSGAVAAAGDLAINTDKFKVTASSGAVAAAGDFAIATDKFKVTASSGAVAAAGDLAINTDKFKVTASSGAVAAAGDFAIATDKFKVTASSGNVTAAGSLSAASATVTGSLSGASASVTGSLSATSLAISTDKFIVDSTGDLKINTNKFTVSSAGAVVAAGAVSAAGDLKIATDKFIVSSTDGKVTSAIPYASYTPAACATNTTTTSASGAEPVLTSATSAYLTTQEYVDKQLWNQTKRINTILGSDESVVTSFNNVYKLVTQFAGESGTVATLNNITGKYDTLVDRAAEIVTSVSDVVSQAYNTVLMNCTPSVWRDECGPVPIPAIISAKTTDDGWYFKNFAAAEKVNWYVPLNGTVMTVGDIKNLYMNIFAVSNVDFPFITIYTKPKPADHALYSKNYASWAGAKITYVYSVASPTSIANESYCLYTNKSPMNVYGKTCLSPSDVATANKDNRHNGTEGALSTTSPKSYDSTLVSTTDEILYIAVHSKSVSLVNQTEFILNSLNVCLKTGTTNFAFSNAGVLSSYFYAKHFQNEQLNGYTTLATLTADGTYTAGTNQKHINHVAKFDDVYHNTNT